MTNPPNENQIVPWVAALLAAATVGRRLRIGCVTTHSLAWLNVYSRQKGGTNLFLKEKKVLWMNKS